jgi:hypothetical protein
MGAAATTLTRAVGDFVDAQVTHDHTDTVILEAPVTAAALPALLAVAASGGALAACGADYAPAEGFPRLMLIVQTYASNDFFTGEHSERNLRLLRGRRERSSYGGADPAAHDVETQTRSKGILGRLLDASADLLTSPILMGTSESCHLRLYLGPDDGCVLLEACIDDLVYKVIADLLFFNAYTRLSSDSNFKVDRRDDGVDVGVEYGGTFGLFEKTGPVLHVGVSRPASPGKCPMADRPPLSPRLGDAPPAGDGTYALARRLANPRWRFARRGAGDAQGDPTITGFALVETLATAPLQALGADDWAWSDKLLAAGRVDWGQSPLSDLVNRFRESTDQAQCAAFYVPHSKLAYNQIAGPEEVAKTAAYAKWLPGAADTAVVATNGAAEASS